MTTRDWQPDILDGYEATTLTFPDDYDGKVVATLVRRHAQTESNKAILWIHGYTDYFFQTHVGDAFTEHGYNFYALDLRKYGRSLREHHHPNLCKSIYEYFPEITESLRIITEEEGNTWLAVTGHSTGGLIMSHYADSGEMRDKLDALFLNSPFYDWNLSPTVRAVIRGLNVVAPLLPAIPLQTNDPVPFFQSIHKDHYGEWDFNLAWRPINGFPVYSGWALAITRAQNQLRQGLTMPCPVLVMHSDKVIHGATYEPRFQTGDSVLNPEHIKAGAKHLRGDVERVEFENGLHDLYLSAPEVREKVLAKTFAWLESVQSVKS